MILKPPYKTRLIYHFRAGIIRLFSPVFTPRDRNLLADHLSDPRGIYRGFSTFCHFLDKRVFIGKQHY